MTIYRPQTEDLLFVLEHIAELESISNLPGFDEVSTDLVTTILDEAGKFAAEVLAPLNRVGDRQGAYLEEGVAKTPDGWKEAYTLFVESGWNSISFSEEIGGQGLPRVVSSAVEELWDSANMAFALCPFLGRAAIEAIERHGSSDQKERYLPPLSSGQWTGTMNLTESQAGTDLSSVRTRAVQDGDHYRITGQKIFITYGDHDLTDNIVHLVLARVEGAPEGVKGISLFIVPKFLLTRRGTLERRIMFAPSLWNISLVFTAVPLQCSHLGIMRVRLDIWWVRKIVALNICLR
jgi:alkylation response protein AidB-like acyl-CoA dehydrogenase